MIAVATLAWSDTISDAGLLLLSGGTGVAAVIVGIEAMREAIRIAVTVALGRDW
jgi:hypothetical protein